MHIVFIAAEYSWPNYVGGIKTFTEILSHSLNEQGHEVHIITTDVERIERHYINNGVYIHCIGPKRIFPRLIKKQNKRIILETRKYQNLNDFIVVINLIRRSWRVRTEVLRLAKTRGIDIIEAPDWNAEGLWLTINSTIPVIITLHGPRFFFNRVSKNPRTSGSILSEYLEKQAIIHSSKIVSPSEYFRKVLINEYKNLQLENRVIVIPNPVDIDFFKKNKDLVIHSDQNDALITYVGRLDYRKGVHILAEAIPEIHNSFPKTKFRFVGADTNTAPDGGSMEKYIKSILQKYLSDIEFTGPLSREELPNQYKNSTIIVLPSLEETFGYTCVEAMASNSCVLASKIEVFTEMIVEDITGFLVTPGDVDALAKKIIYILENPKERAFIANNANRNIIEQMDAKHISLQRISLYKHLIENEKTRQ